MIYDTIIVGAGPAGLTCGIYLARANKRVLIIEKMSIGGQVSEIPQIENYPGFTLISGSDLSMNMYNQAKSVGVEFAFGEVVEYELTQMIKSVHVGSKKYEARAIVVATGSKPRELNINDEKKFLGRGLSYCATCDGNFFKNKIVAVVGSGDSAVSNSQYLSSIAKKVYVLSKYETLKLKNSQINDIEKLENVEVLDAVRVVGLKGEKNIEEICIEKDGATDVLNVDGVFVAIGRLADTNNLKGKLNLDDKGYIIVDDSMQTSQRGVFACGDITAGGVKQIITACSAGAVASNSVLNYLK